MDWNSKTATSIISKALSNRKINVLLPASLETEYIKEIKKWGDKSFNLNKNAWKLVKNSKKNNISPEILISIKNVAKATIKRNVLIDFDKDMDEYNSKISELESIYGFFITVDDISKEKLFI